MTSSDGSMNHGGTLPGRTHGTPGVSRRGYFGELLSSEFAAAMLIAATALAGGWVGFIASDDQYYYSAALKWLEPAWYLPDHFGRVRNSVSLPIAGSIRLFGDHEFATIIPSVVYYLATLVLTFLGLSRATDRKLAFLACALFATFPVVVTAATTASADIAELFWAALAFWLFFHAWRGGGLGVWALLGCGAAMAMAFSGRETVIALGIVVAGAILVGHRIERLQLAWVVLGGLAVLGLEACYYALAGGDPMLRFSLILNGFSASNDRPEATAFSIDGSGALRIHPLLDPLLLVFVRHLFGAGYWVFVAVALLAMKSPVSVTANTRPAAWDLQRLALWGGVIWFLFTAVALHRITLLGRYYIAPTWLFTLAAAASVFTHRIVTLNTRRFWLAATCVVAANFIGIVLQNNNPRLVERELAAFAATSSEPVFTDPYTANYAAEFLHWAEIPLGRVVGAPPVAGALYFVVPARIDAPNRLTPASMLPALQVKPEWEVVRRIDGPAAVPSFLVPMLRSATLIPAWLRAKLTDPRGNLLVVRAVQLGPTTEKSP
ncbi:glycosyltransferase family 39 protein [Accumulibacter sp.]|jgi:4-amino-4-deoxy-L-arabinose transferase-like glycosyltransferase|uniref:glycosyltransferase family 39 protein n=1 Tax=Accumulibacter sp. TaxID=2053492 RepID=UPI001AD17AC9|nr:glycosyltransferase family 39 protein [Accumulibacter sp.]MBN8455290.1 glycosyltransferase family 39 protein [Accumulibacter sp.]